ncbi:MAG: PQQ-dependent dehydrogenase, methanol/ethanol family, partial [Gammaproteobacteria bacterium]
MRKTRFQGMLLAAIATAVPATALANEELLKLQDSPNYWVMQNGDFWAQRYSKLDQINAANASKLQAAWTFSTGVLRGHEGGPLVLPGSATGLDHDTLYVNAPFPNNVFAINLDNLEVVWEYVP